ncbi:MAG: hypothetical protein ABI870_14195 [Rhodanobacter sp.]
MISTRKNQVRPTAMCIDAMTLAASAVTRPVSLTINSFKCIPHSIYKRELCGADALAHFNRADSGLDVGKDCSFNLDVTLRIQVGC